MMEKGKIKKKTPKTHPKKAHTHTYQNNFSNALKKIKKEIPARFTVGKLSPLGLDVLFFLSISF